MAPTNNINLNLYRVFYTVAKTKSFSESTKLLHISQPAISKHIQNLEYELNTQLFCRTNRGIELTEEAKKLLPYIEKAYNFLELGERELLEYKKEEKSVITLGAPTYITTYYIKDKISNFISTNTNVILKINAQNNTIDSLLKHKLDLIILSNNNVTNNNLEEITIYNDKYCFAAHSNYPNLMTITTLNDVLNNNVIAPIETTEERQNLEKYLLIKNLKLNPLIELETTEMILNYTLSGLGIGYLPLEIVNKNPELQIIELPDTLPEKKISILYNKEYLTTTSELLLKELLPEEE